MNTGEKIIHELMKEQTKLKKELADMEKYEEKLENKHKLLPLSRVAKVKNFIIKSKKFLTGGGKPSLKRVAKRISSLPGNIQPQEKKYVNKYVPEPLTTHYSNVTIVIPTYNGEFELDLLFRAIHAQRYLTNIEVIVIDSGSKDKTVEVAKKNGAKVISIPQSKFNHGETRNAAAKQAKGDYIIFTVQDALPLSQTTYAELIAMLTSNENLVAVSTRQQPYPDADMFAKWQIKNHVNALNLEGTCFISNIEGNKDIFDLPFYIKRKITLLDDVCNAVKKKEFLEIGGYKKTDFAEDVDFAVRALEKDYSIGFYGKTSVIHSHVRPAYYFFKRYFADAFTVNVFLKEKPVSPFSSYKNLLYAGLDLYPQYAQLKEDDLLATLSTLIKDLRIPKPSKDKLEEDCNTFRHIVENHIEQGRDLFETSENIDLDLFRYKVFAGILGIHLAVCLQTHEKDVSSKELELIKKTILTNV